MLIFEGIYNALLSLFFVIVLMCHFKNLPCTASVLKL